MFNHNAVFCLTLTVLACCTSGYASPFAPSLPAQDKTEPVLPTQHNYRVLGIVVSKSRAAAVIQTSNDRIHTVQPGERIGSSTVSRITPNAVYLGTKAGILNLPILD